MNALRLPSNPKDIGPFLRMVRVRLGITQESLVAAGVGRQSTISYFENGHTEPQLFTVVAYLTAIGCVLDVSQASGEPFPDLLATPTGTLRSKVYVPRPRASSYPRRKPTTPKRSTAPRIYPKNQYGRCLGCFTTHPEGQEQCS